MKTSGFLGKVDKPEAVIIPASGIYPEIDTGVFRSKMRILDSIANEQVEQKVIEALMFVISQLKEWSAIQINLGYQNLVDIPSTDQNGNKAIVLIAGENEKVLYFFESVYAEAKARLLEEFRDMDLTRKAGADISDRIEKSPDDLRRNCISAIRLIKDEARSFARLV